MTDQPTFSFRPTAAGTRTLHSLARERDFSVDLDALSAFGSTSLLDSPDAAAAQGQTEFERTVADLVAKGMAGEALGRVERRLVRDPADSVLLYLRGDLLLLLDRHVAAAAAIHQALEVVERRGRPRFQALLAKVVQAERGRNLAHLRQALRLGELAGSARVLDGCSPDLMADPQFADLDSYVREGLAGQPKSRLRSLRRAAPVPALPHERLQPLLYWLLREELEAGIQAMNGAEYAAAGQLMAAAEAIDARCSLVAFLYALVLYAGVRKDYDPARPSVVRPYLGDLARAAERAGQAAADASWRAEASELAEHIEQTRELLVHNELIDAINQLVRRFNDLVERYRARPIRTEKQLAEASLAVGRLWADTRTVGGRVAPGSEDATVVADLTEAIRRVQRQLRR